MKQNRIYSLTGLLLGLGLAAATLLAPTAMAEENPAIHGCCNHSETTPCGCCCHPNGDTAVKPCAIKVQSADS